MVVAVVVVVVLVVSGSRLSATWRSRAEVAVTAGVAPPRLVLLMPFQTAVSS